MKLNQKWGWLLAGVFTAGVLWAWLAGGRPHRLTIAIHESLEGDALREIAKRFSATHKIEVQVLQFSYDDLYEKEMAQLENRRDDLTPGFDVIMVDDPWMPALTGKINENDKSRLEALDIDDVHDFPDPTLRVAQYCTGDGCSSPYYGVPFVGNSQLFCYRKAAFPESKMVPQTWDAVVEFVKNQRKQPGPHDTRPYVGRIGPGNSIVTDFVSLLWSHDANAFPETPPEASQHPCSSQTPAVQTLCLGNKGKAAFDDLNALVGGQNGSTSVDDFDLAAYMLKDKANMAVVWSAWVMMLENMRPPGSDDLKFSSVPTGACRDGKGTSGCSTPELGVWLLAVPAGSKLTPEAKEFIEFATSKEQLLRAALIGNPPPRISVLQGAREIADQFPDLSTQSVRDQIHKYDASFHLQLESLKGAHARPRTPRWREMECMLGKYLSKVVVENMDTEMAADQVDEKLKECTGSPGSACADPPECPAVPRPASSAQN